MAWGGDRIQSYYARGMLEIRTTLHLSSRLVVRLNQLLMAHGAAFEGAGAWRAVLPAFVLLDLAIWIVLRRSDRFGLAWRLPLDALDAAFWVLSPVPESHQHDLAVFIAIPLAVEAGVRLGWRALMVPAAMLATTTVAAVATEKPVQIIGVGWIVVAVAVGAGFFRYCRHLDERAEAERQAVLAASRRRAYLAGQNEVAMGASSAVDAIEGLVPVLGRPEPGSALWQLADGWKSQLGASTAEEAKYLQVALLEWERRRNAHPDLSALVAVHVVEGHGTTVLTGGQARALGDALDRIDPRGRVVVGLADPGAPRVPGRPVELYVNGRALLVAGDGRVAPPAFDPCAVAYAYVGVMAVASTLPALGALPLPAGLAGGALCAAAGVFSHREVVVHRERARPQVFALAVAVSVILTLLNGLLDLPVTKDGSPRLGFGIGLLLLSFLGGFYRSTMPALRWMMPSAVTANVLLCVVLFPAPEAVTLAAVVASTAYNLFPYFPCRHLSRTLQRATATHEASTKAVDDGLERAAYGEGRESVVRLVGQARADALRQLAVLAPELDSATADLAAHRLAEVERRLSALGPGTGSPPRAPTS